MTDLRAALEITQLNNAFRTSLSTDLVLILMTSGVACLDAETIVLILDTVRSYDQFDGYIDPSGEHDMCRFTVGDEDYYWKIDYYDRNRFDSPGPAGPLVTISVLTIKRTSKH